MKATKKQIEEINQQPTHSMDIQHFKIAFDQKVLLHLTPYTEGGSTGSFDGVPTWICSDVDILKVVPEPDGLTAWAYGQGKVGVAIILIAGDADLSQGVDRIANDIVFDVTYPQIKSFTVTADAPITMPKAPVV